MTSAPMPPWSLWAAISTQRATSNLQAACMHVLHEGNMVGSTWAIYTTARPCMQASTINYVYTYACMRHEVAISKPAKNTHLRMQNRAGPMENRSYMTSPTSRPKLGSIGHKNGSADPGGRPNRHSHRACQVLAGSSPAQSYR